MRVNTLEAVGDYIHVEDVAAAIAALLRAPQPALQRLQRRLPARPRASASWSSWAAEKVPGFHAEVVPPEQADIVQDPLLRDGMWGAYDVSRIGADTGWTAATGARRRCTPTWTGSWPSATPARRTPSEPQISIPAIWSATAAAHPIRAGPAEARIAVSLVLNYEEGAEACVLHGDAHSESVLTDLGAVAPLAGARELNVESNFEYGSRVGFWEIMRLLQGAGAPATVFAVGMALERNPAAAAEIARSGFEVACHGQRWIDYQFGAGSRGACRHAAQLSRPSPRLTGRRPVGWYTGRPSVNTRRLVVENGGFLYDSDAYNDDLPYFTAVAGRRHLVVPYSFDTNDSRLQRGGDFATGEQYFNYCRDAFDWLYRMGTEGRPRMLSLGLHGRIIGRPGRIGALARLLEHIQRHAGCLAMLPRRHRAALDRAPRRLLSAQSHAADQAAIDTHDATGHVGSTCAGDEGDHRGEFRRVPVAPGRDAGPGAALHVLDRRALALPPCRDPAPRGGRSRCAPGPRS